MSCVPQPHFLLPLPTMQWATDLERDGHYLEQAYCFSEAQQLGRQSSWTLGILIRMQHTSFISVIFVLLNRLLFWDKTSSVYLVSRFRDSAAINVIIRDNLMSQAEHTLHPSCVRLSSFPCPTLSVRWTLSPWDVMIGVRSAQCCVPAHHPTG